MSPDAQHQFRKTLKDARTQPMPAITNDQNAFGEGDLNQELIDQMLNGGDSSGTVQPDPWADDALQAEIDAARAATGNGLDVAPITNQSRPGAHRQPRDLAGPCRWSRL